MGLLNRKKWHLGQPYWQNWPKDEVREIADGWRDKGTVVRSGGLQLASRFLVGNQLL